MEFVPPSTVQTSEVTGNVPARPDSVAVTARGSAPLVPTTALVMGFVLDKSVSVMRVSLGVTALL